MNSMNVQDATEQVPSNSRARRYQVLKHAVDFCVAVLLLLVFWPLLLLLVVAIRLESRGPAVYRQVRVGQFGEPFTIFKFRSMKIDTPVLSTEEMQRQGLTPFTRLGPFLRKSNLDEFPQLLNILKGDMSFVGPRPALPSQTDVNELRREMGVEIARPGITGLAQARGRDDLDTVTKVTYDAEYCRTMSLGRDIAISLETFGTVLTARGNK
jgi:lipopolysaccharide/colanic/teichoic acid biosynthesis glycosyltransferase